MKKGKDKTIDIVQKGEPVLRKIAEKVSVADIKTEKIQRILKDMSLALELQDDGVAIAAPQVAIPLRIFVVSKKVEIMLKGLEEAPEVEKEKIKDAIYINPEIKKLSKTKQVLDEGCLSVRPIFGKVERAEKATVTAYDENGKKFTRGGSGLLAQIFQHEIDHLNGILFIDKATDLVEVLPPQNNE
ncbi:MAG: peptide deformylase [bacterium]